MLNVKRDLVGKTITGVIAVPGHRGEGDDDRKAKPNEIWMMQFSDGSYVEFVSPAARRGLRRSARRVDYRGANQRSTRAVSESESSPQLALNVA